MAEVLKDLLNIMNVANTIKNMLIVNLRLGALEDCYAQTMHPLANVDQNKKSSITVDITSFLDRKLLMGEPFSYCLLSKD